MTCIHIKAGFPVWEELFTAVNGYLVNHSSSYIFDDTVTFPDPENVDFDVLCFVSFTAILFVQVSSNLVVYGRV